MSKGKTAAEPQEQTARMPSWYQDYQMSFGAAEAHAFILYGDIDGYVQETLSQRRFLVTMLAQKREVVVLYDLAGGITFADEAMRKIALGYLKKEKEEEITIDEFEQRLGTEGDRLQARIGSRAPTQDEFREALANVGIGPSQDTEEEEDPFAARRPLDALRILETLMRATDAKGNVAVLVDYSDKVMPPKDVGTMTPDERILLVLLQRWGVDRSLGNCNNPIFLLTRELDDLHPDIKTRVSGYKAIELPIPDYEGRLDFVNYYLARRKERGRPISLIDIDEKELSRLTAGLNLKNLEDLLLLAAKAGGVTIDLVVTQKNQVISREYGDLVEIIDPLPNGFKDLGGMDEVINWLMQNIVTPLREGRVKDVPKGVLLVGPPGTGKTFLVRALARVLGFNALAINMENILGGIVGTSERNLKKVLGLARAISPVLMFIDEVDQTDVSRRGNTSGNPVASNLFSAVLRFMGDKTLQGKVVMCIASNRPDLLDSALTRFERIDATLPIRLAKEKGRLGIVNAQARMQDCDIEEEAAVLIAQKAVKYSAADLGAVVKKARIIATQRGNIILERPVITLADAERAMKAIRPETPQIAEYYTLLMIKAVKDTELLEQDELELLSDPAGYRQKLREAKKNVPASLLKSKTQEDDREERDI